jgi:LPXTG-motif cell wall-anchored protein
MIRYEAYKFYADAVSSPPSSAAAPYIPASGETGKGRPNVIGVVIGVVIVLLLLGLFLIWKRKVIQHFYKKRLPGHSKLSIELSTALSKSKLNYKYSTLRAATKNFNPANKIGEGGFGSVYKVMS